MINLILHSRYGDEYEIVAGGGAPLSSCGCRYDADDFTYTRQFISHLLISPQAWRNLFQRLGYNLPPNIHHPAEMLDVVTRFCLKGVLAFYKLPRIESLQALSSGEGWGICLVKGPNPHCHSELEVFEISTPEEAEALLDTVSASERELVRVMFVNNMTQWFSFDGDTRNKVIQMLAKRELLAYKVEVTENAPPPKAAEYVAATGPGYDKVSLGPETNSDTPAKAALASPILAERRGVPPTSLADAANRLNSMKEHIALNGHQCKYTDTELLQQAQIGDVAKERFHVRFMEADYQWKYGEAVRDPANLTGALGRDFQGSTGKGARYWSTTFDQIEDADSDAKLIAEKLGVPLKAGANYVMVIIDTEKAIPLTGVESVAATFGNVSEFANRELPADFPKEFTNQVMNSEFQALYKEHYDEAVEQKFLKYDGAVSIADFKDYLKTTNLSGSESEQLIKRMKMHDKICNNHDYLGNGVTKNNIVDSTNHHGAVETHNFERTETNLQKLKDNDAIAVVQLG